MVTVDESQTYFVRKNDGEGTTSIRTVGLSDVHFIPSSVGPGESPTLEATVKYWHLAAGMAITVSASRTLDAPCVLTGPDPADHTEVLQGTNSAGVTVRFPVSVVANGCGGNAIVKYLVAITNEPPDVELVLCETSTFLASLNVTPPPSTVTIASLTAVPKGQTVDVQVTISPSPSPDPITLTLTRTSGMGEARFANGSTMLTITESTTVRIKGVTQSSTADNIRLDALPR